MRYILWVAMLEGACDVIQDGHHLPNDPFHDPSIGRQNGMIYLRAVNIFWAWAL